MAATRNHDVGMSIAKAICIIAMVVGHSGAPEWMCRIIYQFHMPCFFIISGYFLSELHIDNYKASIRKRFKGIWWYYVKWTLIFLLLHNIFAAMSIVGEPYKPADMLLRSVVALKLGYGEDLLGGYWFLADLFYAAVFTILFFKGMRHFFPGFNVYRYVWVLILLFLVCGACLTGFDVSIPMVHATLFFSTAFFLTGFYIRVWIQQHVSPGIMSGNRALALAGFVFIALLSVVYTNSIPASRGWHYFPYYFIAVVGSLAVINISKLIARHNHWGVSLLNFIGGETLVILTLHLLSFKLVSYLKILHYGLPKEHLQHFPVISEHNGYYWLLYAAVGITLPLTFGYLSKAIGKTRLLKMQWPRSAKS